MDRLILEEFGDFYSIRCGIAGLGSVPLVSVPRAGYRPKVCHWGGDSTPLHPGEVQTVISHLQRWLATGKLFPPEKESPMGTHEKNPDYWPVEVNDSAGAELPRYKSHKIVQAAKIARIYDLETGESLLLFEDRLLDPVRVRRDYMDKHEPRLGGYYVRYADGYESFSPAQAFEEGYTKLLGGGE